MCVQHFLNQCVLFQLFSAAEEEVALDVGADPATAASVMLRMKHAFNPAATAPPTLPPNAPQNSNGQPGQLPETPAGGGGPADEERKPKKPRKEKPAVT